MNTSLLKKIASIVVAQNSTEQMLLVVDQLLILMKKFGKHISQKSIADFIKKEYFDAYGLYELLGSSRCTIKHCLLLRQYLRQELGDRFIVAHIAHDMISSTLHVIDDNIVVNTGGDKNNPLLFIQSSTKTYRRSLNDDLAKII